MDDHSEPQQSPVDLALAQAKRVNRESRLLVRTLAKMRDDQNNPQPQEAQEDHEHRSS